MYSITRRDPISRQAYETFPSLYIAVPSLALHKACKIVFSYGLSDFTSSKAIRVRHSDPFIVSLTLECLTNEISPSPDTSQGHPKSLARRSALISSSHPWCFFLNIMTSWTVPVRNYHRKFARQPCYESSFIQVYNFLLDLTKEKV